MKTSDLWFPAAVLALIGLAGCASGPSTERSVEDRTCIRVSAVDSFDALDDQHVVVEAIGDDHYLLTLQPPCNGLSFASGITFAETLDRVCGDGTSWLTFTDPGVGPKRCRILDIEPVADASAARELIERRGE